MQQALSIWSDLESALHGTNSFAGDTAEIYIYRLLTHSPGLGRYGGVELDRMMSGSGIIAEGLREDYDNANTSLHDLLKHFAKEHGATIEVNDKELGAWLKTARFTHRVHVKVTPRKGSLNDYWRRCLKEGRKSVRA